MERDLLLKWRQARRPDRTRQPGYESQGARNEERHVTAKELLTIVDRVAGTRAGGEDRHQRSTWLERLIVLTASAVVIAGCLAGIGSVAAYWYFSEHKVEQEKVKVERAKVELAESKLQHEQSRLQHEQDLLRHVREVNILEREREKLTTDFQEIITEKAQVDKEKTQLEKDKAELVKKAKELTKEKEGLAQERARLERFIANIPPDLYELIDSLLQRCKLKCAGKDLHLGEDFDKCHDDCMRSNNE